MTITSDDLSIELETELECRELLAREALLNEEIRHLIGEEAALSETCLSEGDEWDASLHLRLDDVSVSRLAAQDELCEIRKRLAQL